MNAAYLALGAAFLALGAAAMARAKKAPEASAARLGRTSGAMFMVAAAGFFLAAVLSARNGS